MKRRNVTVARLTVPVIDRVDPLTAHRLRSMSATRSLAVKPAAILPPGRVTTSAAMARVHAASR